MVIITVMVPMLLAVMVGGKVALTGKAISVIPNANSQTANILKVIYRSTT